MEIDLPLELKTKIKFTAHPAEQSLHCPDVPGEIEVEDITILGCEITQDLFDAIIKDQEDEITGPCEEHAMDEELEDRIAEAEHKRDCKEDR